ncbi:MAG: T9SS type A sorting domain-containing protein, partial [Nitrosopumilus sp.]|nr:T9SS type A sorting domain-containing protein [Nitrosopumilus sp.]
GSDNLAVGWVTPGSSGIAVIPGSVLSPFIPTCTSSGSILREYWSGITGNSVTAIPLTTTPTSTSQLTSFEAPTNAGDNYSQRIRGYICAPVTGSYTFYIASDDNSELWLSTSEDPSNKQKIAFVSGYTSSREWTKFSSQKSASITMQAGTKYYVEVLHKEGSGGDNIAVGWVTPGSSSIAVIPGSVLSPFVITEVVKTTSNMESFSSVSEVQINNPPLLSTHNQLTVSPNPATNNINLSLVGFDHNQPMQISLLSMSGNRIREISSSTSTNILSIDVSTLPKGIYIISVVTGDFTGYKQFVKQ